MEAFPGFVEMLILAPEDEHMSFVFVLDALSRVAMERAGAHVDIARSMLF